MPSAGYFEGNWCCWGCTEYCLQLTEHVLRTYEANFLLAEIPHLYNKYLSNFVILAYRKACLWCEEDETQDISGWAINTTKMVLK